MVKLSLSEDNQNLHTVELSYQAAPGKSVGVAGSFNDWDPELLPMAYSPETSAYKFVVDGEWVLDESNPNFAANDFGTLNSVINVG